MEMSVLDDRWDLFFELNSQNGSLDVYLFLVESLTTNKGTENVYLHS